MRGKNLIAIICFGVSFLFFQNCSNVNFKEVAQQAPQQADYSSQQIQQTEVAPDITADQINEPYQQIPAAEVLTPAVAADNVQKITPITCAVKSFIPATKPDLTASTIQSLHGTIHVCAAKPKNYQVEVICDTNIPDKLQGVYIQYHANYNRPIVINAPSTSNFDYRGISYYLPGVASVSNIGAGKAITSLTKVKANTIRFDGSGLFFQAQACGPGDCSCIKDWDVGIRIYIEDHNRLANFNKETPATFKLK